MNRSKQREIFDAWLAQHRGLLFKVVRVHAFTPHDRDDLFQEIATQVWHSIPHFRGESAVTTWLYRVALRCAIAWSQKEKRRRDRHPELGSLSPEDARSPFGAARGSADGERKPMLREITGHRDRGLDWLYEQIARLDDIDRALTLLLLDGFSHREIAATLGLSETSVGVKIHRIKNHLADRSREEIEYGL
ncbi:MAG: RNA polymerase sigma factor [Opitutaceae bacterium]